MSKAFIILLIATWFLNSHVLLYFWPYKTHEEYYKFISKSNITYEIMILFAVVAYYFETQVSYRKAVSCFMMILIFSSIIDKALFQITYYLWSDIALVFLALIVSVIVWKKHG